MKKQLLKVDVTKMPAALKTLQERLNSHDLADVELSTITGGGPASGVKTTPPSLCWNCL